MMGIKEDFMNTKTRLFKIGIQVLLTFAYIGYFFSLYRGIPRNILTYINSAPCAQIRHTISDAPSGEPGSVHNKGRTFPAQNPFGWTAAAFKHLERRDESGRSAPGTSGTGSRDWKGNTGILLSAEDEGGVDGVCTDIWKVQYDAIW